MLFTLANQYAANELYTEAINTYQMITKNRMFANAYRLKVNMGNIYFKQGQYQMAVKMFRMALDQVPSSQKNLRYFDSLLVFRICFGWLFFLLSRTFIYSFIHSLIHDSYNNWFVYYISYILFFLTPQKPHPHPGL